MGAAEQFLFADLVFKNVDAFLVQTSNSLGQSPCTVAAYLMATCNGGSFYMPPLEPGNSYPGPTGGDDGDLCKCNTVVYSLLSACDACQQEPWIDWLEYSLNCTNVMPVPSFPNPIPSGTRVPQWALLDVTFEDIWNNDTSFAVGDFPEITPGMVIPPNGAYPGPPSTPYPSRPTQSSSSNAGAIAGGAVGGVAAIAVASLAVFFWLRRKRPQAPSAAFVVDGPPQPLMGEVRPPGSDDGTHGPSSIHETPASPMKLYDPKDPTTFPGQVHTAVPVAPYSGHTVAIMQTPPSQEYHGLPII
ncbi:hypothetical protein BJV78DRAFT_148240 [Lactifluus subvellereus]|nr:hypothetical protein BJV78DRAFT_148240 [Lactifluus subvellereus]